MATVIVRLQPATGDGELHGRVEVVGDGVAVAFTDDAELLALLHAAAGTTPLPVSQGAGRTPDGDLNRT